MYTKKTIIVSNRLPVRIERKDNQLKILQSEGGLATGLGSIYREKNNIWIGWPGFIPENEQEKEEITEKLAELSLVPVFLTACELEGFYEGFSNEVLWPICHYHPSFAVYDPHNWAMYSQVNEKFAKIISNHIENDLDEVWVHDYQLMLLPKLVRDSHAQLSIGYFQHIPFPPDEVFRGIPWRDELLKGLLGADLIAFHTFNDSQHFLQACTHILGKSIQNNCLQSGGRSVFVEVYPMGIDYDKFNQLAKSDAVQKRALEIRQFYGDRKFVLSIDRLDYSKGIIERIEAFEDFLLSYPSFRDKVVMYMLIVPSRDSVPKYKELKDEINRRVGQINAVYGSHEWTPISYFYTSLDVQELSALYVAADVCLVTSLRDGMNLVCKEFIASKEINDGVLILSEMAGASKELIGPLLVNPNDIQQIKEALFQSLNMSTYEQRKRMDDSIEIVKKFNVRHWVKLFLSRLRSIKAIQQRELSRRINPKILEDILFKFSNAKKALFFLDYDGTLIGFNNNANDAVPTLELYNLLQKLNTKGNSQIVIISGRPQPTLEHWFSDKEYYLIAEHGTWSNFPDFKWKSKSHISIRWKIPIKHIMTKFSNMTAGAVLEEKNYSLAWHYRKVQVGLGQQRAQELVDNLMYLIPHHGLQLLRGNKVIEVKNSELNKGIAAMEIVNNYKPDFIFAIGDDTTDEDMFLELPPQSITIKVGNRKSAAKFYVDSQEDVIKLLKKFVNEEPQLNKQPLYKTV